MSAFPRKRRNRYFPSVACEIRDVAPGLWRALTPIRSLLIAVLNPHHIRDVDMLADRYQARAFGPRLFFPYDIPRTELEPIERHAHGPADLGRPVVLATHATCNESAAGVSRLFCSLLAPLLRERRS
jgi:hypothetical protein